MNSISLKADLDSLLPGVLSYLSKLVELPKTGFLAGGSLGNLLWAAYTFRPLSDVPVNDVDIFHLQSYQPDIKMGDVEPTASAWRIIDTFTTVKEANTTRTTFGLAGNQETTSYIRHYLERQLNRYMKIERAERNGLLNSVYYSANENRPTLLIDSFDINATMVAYDFETGLLTYSKHFEQFLLSNELKVINFHTPYHSLIRVCEKSRQLGIAYDIKTDLGIYAQFTRSRISNSRTKFGIKYRNLYHQNIEILSQYFELVHVKHSVSEFPIWTLQMDEEIFKTSVDEGVKNLFDISDINYYCKHVRFKGYKATLWNLTQSIWLQQGEAFLDGLNEYDLTSARTIKAAKHFSKLLDINGTLSLSFGRVKLSQLIKLMDWFELDKTGKNDILLYVTKDADFTGIDTYEDFEYYTSILTVANRKEIAVVIEDINKRKNNSVDEEFDLFSL